MKSEVVKDTVKQFVHDIIEDPTIMTMGTKVDLNAAQQIQQDVNMLGLQIVETADKKIINDSNKKAIATTRSHWYRFYGCGQSASIVRTRIQEVLTKKKGSREVL